MAGGLLRKPRGEILTPLGLNRVMAEKRGAKPAPVSKRAIAARLRGQKREDDVLAAQRPALAHGAYEHFLRTGAL